jgi:hypothetical protein
MRFAVLCLAASAVFPLAANAPVPVFEITRADSSIKFNVNASVAINGTFERSDASSTFTSPELSTGVLDIKITPTV